MGAVYEAVHTEIARRAAVKVLSQQLARSREYAARFLNEAKAVNIVSHPNLVEIFAYDRAPDGTLFLVMELLHGELLAARLARSPHGLPRALALRFGFEIAAALALAHEKGIVHRDLKPENVMLVPDPRSRVEHVKILDFGIAKVTAGRARSGPDADIEDADAIDHTQIGRAMGSPDYMAPEQFGSAETVTGHADVFALGLLLCELLGGQRPYDGNALRLKTGDAVLRLPPRVSPALLRLIRRMLSLEPAQRPSMAEVAGALERAQRTLPWSWIAGGAGVLVIAGVALFFGLRARPDLRTDLERYRDVQPLAEAVLSEGLRGADPELRGLSVRAIGSTRRADLLPLLSPYLAQVRGTSARAEEQELWIALMQAAGELGAAARPSLVRLAVPPLASPVPTVAAGALCRSGEPASCAALTKALPSLAGRTRFLAAQALCQTSAPGSCAVLSDVAGAPDAVVRLSGAERLDAWALAARQGEAAAVQKLRGLADGASDARLSALGKLAGLRSAGADPVGALRELETVARSARDGALAAALLCAQLHSTAGLTPLLAALERGRQAPQERAQVALALAELGELDAVAEPLTRVLRAPAQPLEVRVGAAAALLRLLGAAQQGLGALSLGRLTGGSSAALWLVDGAAGADTLPEEETERRIALVALGRVRSAAEILAREASRIGARSRLRAEALRSLLALRDAAAPSERPRIEQALRTVLRQLSIGPDLTGRVLAAVLKLRLGEGDARGQLRALRDEARTDDAARELLVDLLRGKTEADLLREALSDAAFAVRFRAACILAEGGSAAGEAVLREALARSDGHALIAYGYLRDLKLTVDRAGLDLAALLGGEQQLWVRFQATQMLRTLPPGDALPLLRQSLSDPAAAIRAVAADLLAELLARTHDRRFLSLLLILRNDEEPAVRWRAERALAGYLPQAAPTTAATTTTTTVQTAPATPAPPVPPPAAAPPAANPPAPAPPVPPSPQGSTKVPPSPAAAAKKPPARPAGPGIEVGDRLLAAAQKSEQKSLPDAMSRWQALLELPADQRTPQASEIARKAMDRLRKQLGSYERVVRGPDGACRREAKQWVYPGVSRVKCPGGEVLEYTISEGQSKEAKCCR